MIITMEYKIERNEEPKKVDKIDVFIGDCKYRLTETVDGKLEVHKTTEGLQEEMLVFPIVTNVINIK